MKIGFLTFFGYSSAPYYHYLKDHAECVWAVFNPYLYKELVKQGEKKIVLCDNPLGVRAPQIISRLIHRAYNIWDPSSYLKIYQHLISKVNPDLWITDMTLPLLQTRVEVPKVLVFHSVPYKQYIIRSDSTKYDLVMVPAPYFKDALLKLEPKTNPSKIRVVGWPRSDIYFQANFSREEILEELCLDPKRKTVMLAPSWDIRHQEASKRFFPQSWGDMEANFEVLCKVLQEKKINFIVKLHATALPLFRDKTLPKIARRYGAVWLVKKSKYFNIDPRKFLFLTDILISDISGIITDYLALDRPIIYIDIKDPVFWGSADLSREDRCGDCVQDIQGLVKSIDENIKNPSRHAEERQKLREKALYKVDGQATKRACDAILDFMYNRNH